MKINRSPRRDRKIPRPHPGVGPQAFDKPIRTGRGIRHRNPAAGPGITLSGRLEVKPHYEFSRARIEDHLGALEHAAADEFTGRIAGHGERDARILPAVQINGRIDVHAHLRPVALLAANLVLAKPVSRVERAAKRLPAALRSPSSNRAGGFPAHGLPSPHSFGLVSAEFIASKPRPAAMPTACIGHAAGRW